MAQSKVEARDGRVTAKKARSSLGRCLGSLFGAGGVENSVLARKLQNGSMKVPDGNCHAERPALGWDRDAQASFGLDNIYNFSIRRWIIEALIDYLDTVAI